MMKYIILNIIYLLSFSTIINAQEILNVNTKTNKIHFIINENFIINWRIVPEKSVDRYNIYCYSDSNQIKILSDIDSIVLNFSENDTLRINIIKNNSDTAYTELIGIHEFPNRISKQDKIFYLSLFWSECKYNFINLDQVKFDFDSLYRAFIMKVLESKNDYEYYQVLKMFASSLGDAHTEIFNNGQFNQYFDYAPVSFMYLNDHIYIVGYRENLSNKLEFGAEVLKINGISSKDYLKKFILPYISASTDAQLWLDAANYISRGPKEKPLEITVVNLNNDTTTLHIERNGESTRYDIRGNEKFIYKSLASFDKHNVDFYFNSDSIAIIKYNRFSPEETVILEFNKIVPILYKAKGLIIDIRNNRGGSTNTAYNLLKYIIEDKYFLTYAWETRINDGVRKAMGYGYEEYKDYYQMKSVRVVPSDTIFIPDSLKRFNVPIAILIGAKTMSAAEDFLIMLDEVENRPIFIGEPTAGSTGAPLVITGFPGEGYTRICTRRCLFPYSLKPFVNNGIEPDIYVSPTIHNIINCNDVVLDRAILEIKNKLNKSN